MALVIPTNVASLDAQKSLTRNSNALGKSFARLSSGFRINTAADDAAGLAISESMKAQIRSYTIAERNANEAISMTQTAEAALGSMHDILGRMRELAIESSNGSMTGTDRGYLDTEFTALKQEMGRIQGSSKFNGKQLVATTGSQIIFQVGLKDDLRPGRRHQLLAVELGRALNATHHLLQRRELGVQVAAVGTGHRPVRALDRQLAHAS